MGATARWHLGMIQLLFIVRAIDRTRRWAFVGTKSQGPLVVSNRPGGHMYRLSVAI